MKLQKGTDTAFVFKISPFISGIFLFAYCSIIFGISSFSRPTEDLNLPTGTWPHLIEYAGLGLLAYVFFAVRAKRSFLVCRSILGFVCCFRRATSIFCSRQNMRILGFLHGFLWNLCQLSFYELS